MKKQMVLGMLVASFLASPAAHAVEVVDIRAKVESELRDRVNAEAFGNKSGAAGLAGVKAVEARTKLMNDLDIRGNDASNLTAVLDASSGAVLESRLNTLATIVASRKVAAQLSAQGKGTDAAKLNETADALMMQLSKADLTGAIENQPADVTAALVKMESPDMAKTILSMKDSSRAKYTEFLKEKNDQMEKTRPTISAEEAAIRAMMKVESISREDAIKKLKDIKDCLS